MTTSPKNETNTSEAPVTKAKTARLLVVAIPIAAVLALGTFGCAYLRTPKVLDLLNAPSSGADATARPSVTTRVGRLVRESLADSYFIAGPDASNVGTWMRALGERQAPIADQLACLRGKRGQDVSSCYDVFRAAVLPSAAGPGVAATTSSWGVVAPPPLAVAYTVSANPRDCDAIGKIVADPSPTAGSFRCETTDAALLQSAAGAVTVDAKQEIDAERFVANAIGIAPTLLALEDSLGRPLTAQEVSAGIANGAAEAAAYVRTAPRWRRDDKRASTALVMSGGAANGAFTAGFVWRTLEVLRRCRAGEVPGCADARIDLVVGSSTGSLVGVLVDLFHVKGQERAAMNLLVDNYTCVDESKLYCVNDKLDWKLATDVRGIVRFDGIRALLKGAMSTAPIGANATELVTMTVDYDSGDLFAISDQDPVDAADIDGRVDAVLSSIVEPVFAEPVDSIGRKNAPAYKGTFIDGGIRSGLPVLEAMRRGAERMIAISTSSVETDPIAHPTAATQILFRSIDILVQQPRVGELQEAESGAVVRRMQEYSLCVQRFAATTRRDARERFCRREALFQSSRAAIAPLAAVTTWLGPMSFPEIARSWQTQWVYRPEEVPKAPSATGYSFDPDLMRTIFKQGLEVFQSRCDETLRLIGIPDDVRAGECTPARATALSAYFDAAFKAKPSSQCRTTGPKYRICE